MSVQFSISHCFMFTQTGSFKGNPSPLLSTHAEGQNSRLFASFGKVWLAPSNISLTFRGRCQEIKKATENIGFQIARFANRLRSATNWFENCPARATKDWQTSAKRRFCRFRAEPLNLFERCSDGTTKKAQRALPVFEAPHPQDHRRLVDRR